jgi:hypothetical protein
MSISEDIADRFTDKEYYGAGTRTHEVGGVKQSNRDGT